MSLEMVLSAGNFPFVMVGEDVAQVSLIPLVKTDVPEGWVGRCGISRTNPNQESWCLVFEAACFHLPKIQNTNIWLTEQAQYLNTLARFCTDNYGFMHLNVQGAPVISRLAWSVDTIKKVGVVESEDLLSLTGSLVFNLPSDTVVSGTIPIIVDLINTINQVAL